MYKLLVLAAVVAVANAGAVYYTAPAVVPAAVGYSAAVVSTPDAAKTPASTTLVKNSVVATPVVSSVVAGSPVVYSSGLAPSVYSYSGVPVYSYSGVPVYSYSGVPVYSGVHGPVVLAGK